MSQQQGIEVYYEGLLVGEYFPDLIVEGKVIIELKAAEAISDAFEAQLLNYLAATEIEVGLLLNFGPEPNFRWRVFANSRKALHSASRSRVRERIDEYVSSAAGSFTARS